MTEAALWTTARGALRPYGELERIENRVGSDVPDFHYCLLGWSGWVEMKHERRWPVRESTPVRAALTAGQAKWLTRWARAGSSTWVLWQIDRTYLLVPGSEAETLRGGVSRATLRDMAGACATGRFPTEEVMKCLTRRRT